MLQISHQTYSESNAGKLTQFKRPLPLLPRSPHLITTLPGPRAKALVNRDHAVTSPSYTRDYPLVVSRGEGCMVEDVDGNVFLDRNSRKTTSLCH
jgi:4-aminobutyrate aminotransferase-like enzyme